MQLSIGNQTFIIPDTESPCDAWRVYYDQLKRSVGKTNAQTIWLLTWGQNGSISCTTNADFNDWLKKQGLEVSSATTRLIADLSGIGGNVLGLGKNLTKAMAIGTPILLGGVTLVILILLINMARKGDLRDLAMLHPAGRKAMMASSRQQIPLKAPTR